MEPNRKFLQQPREFWANVRTVSEAVGYTSRGKGQIKVPTLHEIARALSSAGLGFRHIMDYSERLTDLGNTLVDYFEYRAKILNEYVEPRLMDVGRAEQVFEEMRATSTTSCPIPLNKQSGTKKKPAFLTGIVNMLVSRGIGAHDCNFDPRQLTTVTRNGRPLRTLARRVDGAFPGAINPVAIWEIKEYYYTTTFGSRVADGVYESLLDGLELEEIREHESIDIKHYLIVDSHFTWWECGRSYLCRIMDMLHMGYLDEALFGYEVVERLPAIVQQWTKILEARK